MVLNVDFYIVSSAVTLYSSLLPDVLCQISVTHFSKLLQSAIFAGFHFNPADYLSLFVNLLTTTTSLKLRFGVIFNTFSYLSFAVAFTTTLFLVSMTGS